MDLLLVQPIEDLGLLVQHFGVPASAELVALQAQFRCLLVDPARGHVERIVATSEVSIRTGSTLRRLPEELISVGVSSECDCGSTGKMAP